MAQTDLVQAFEARLKLYSLDDRARRILAESWPVIEPGLDEAITEIVTAIRVLPRIGEIVAKNAALYKKLEAAHFRALLGGKLDGAYAESCRHTVLQEAAMGLDPRVRSTAGSYVLKAALDALARKHRFSAAKVAERGRVISQAISFDVANAITLHRQAAEQASAARRGAIDDAIAEFAGAIGEVVEAIKEAAGSLTTTCSTLTLTTDPMRSAAIAVFAQRPGGALMVGPDPFTIVHIDEIAQLAANNGLPSISVYRPFVVAGGLMSYGPDTAEIFRQAASYVDRILKGEHAADLPVQQPTKFEFIVNLKAAKGLSLSVPSNLLSIADEVIE